MVSRCASVDHNTFEVFDEIGGEVNRVPSESGSHVYGSFVIPCDFWQT